MEERNYYNSYNQNQDFNNSYGEKNKSEKNIKKPKKKRIGLKIFLSFFLIILSIIFIVFCVAISTYHNFQIPNYDKLNDDNLKNIFEEKFDTYLNDKGERDVNFNFSQEDLNKILYQFFYKSFFKDSEFLKKDSNDKYYLKKFYDKNKNPTYAFKGAWFKLNGEYITICAGLDLFKPIKYKTSVYLTFKIEFNKDTKSINLILKKAYVGNLVISLNLFKKILFKVAQSNKGLKKTLDDLRNGYPLKEPLLSVDFDNYTLKMPVERILAYVKNETNKKNLYKKEKEEDVSKLYNKLSDDVSDKKIFDFEFKNSKLTFTLKTKSIKNNIDDSGISFYNTSDRIVDILKDIKSEIFIGLNNTSAKDILQDDEKLFSIVLPQEKLRKIFMYAVMKQDLKNVAIFEQGIKLRLNKNSKFKYRIRAKYPDIVSIKDGIIDVVVKIEIFKDDDESKKVETTITFKTKPILEKSNLILEIENIKFGNFLDFNQDILKGIIAHLKNTNFIKDNTFVFENFIEKLEELSKYKIIDLKVVESQLCIIVEIDDNDLKTIKDALIQTLIELKEKYSGSDNELDILIDTSKKYTFSEKAKAINDLFKNDRNKKVKFYEDLVYYLNIKVGRELLEILKIQGDK